MWNSGATARTTSSSVTFPQSRQRAAAHRTWRWVFIAALGGPVVPDV
jgi:hypothetical protein